MESSGPSQASQGSTGFQGNQSWGRGLGPSGQEPMGFQEGKPKIPLPGRSLGGQGSSSLSSSLRTRAVSRGPVTAVRAIRQALFGGWTLGPVSIGQGSSRWARSGRAGKLLEARQQLCLCARSLAKLPTAFLGLLFPCRLWDRSQPGPPRAWVPMFGSLELLLGRQGWKGMLAKDRGS